MILGSLVAESSRKGWVKVRLEGDHEEKERQTG